MKEILFLTTQFPYPLDNGGKIGAFNGLNVISQNNNVTVLSFVEDESYIDEGLDYLKQVLPNVTFIRPIKQDIHIRKKPLKLIKALLSGIVLDMPYAVSKFQNKEMTETIDRIIKKKHWNLLFIDYINMCAYGKYVRTKYRKCFDYFIFKDHNKEYELVKQEAEKYSGIRKKILENDSKRTMVWECSETEAADLVYSVCDENANFLRKYNINTHSMLPTYSIQTVGDGSENAPRTNNILYIGGLSWAANLKGLKWFVENVFPIVRAKIPSATLTVVGGGLSGNPFKGCDGVEYLGYVKDLNDIYLNKSAFIVPLFEGSGIRIKILEAFDKQVPVVSTSIGCNTIGAVNNWQIIIADDQQSFAEGIISLLNDNDFNYKIRTNAKAFLKNKFSLKQRQEEFENEVANLYKDKDCQ